MRTDNDELTDDDEVINVDEQRDEAELTDDETDTPTSFIQEPLTSFTPGTFYHPFKNTIPDISKHFYGASLYSKFIYQNLFQKIQSQTQQRILVLN